MVEAVHFLDIFVQRAAHDVPHDQFDAFRTRFAQVFDVINLTACIRLVDQQIHEAGIPVGIDQARALVLQLVRHAPGTKNTDFQVFALALNGLANSLA